MKNIKKILIAVDLDDLSLEVLEYGVTLSILLNAKVKCIHVSNPYSTTLIKEANDIEGSFIPGQDKFTNIEDVLQQDLNSLQHLIDIVKDRLGLENHPIETEVISGFTVPEILAESNSWHASVIIVGMHKNPFKPGKSSIVSELIDQTKTSIIIVPSTYVNRNLDKLSVFINFQFDELNLILDVVEWVRQNNLEIIFTHIIDQEKDLLVIKNRLSTYHRLFKNEIKSGSVSFQVKTKHMSEVLTSLSNDDGVDLNILRSQKRHWSLFLLKAIESDTALKYIKVPLMIWKDAVPSKVIIQA
jgi:nucleotide-binding universal stress UspA family protein